MRETIEQSRLRIQEFEERQRRVKQEPMENPDVADYRSWQIANAEVCIAKSSSIHMSWFYGKTSRKRFIMEF